MDAPLLALTRRSTAPTGLTAESAAAETMRQLVQLRWMAFAGQMATILFVHVALNVRLPIVEMLGLALMLGAVNLFITLTLARHQVRNIEIMLALLIDMAVLTLQLYLSGGAENPFISLYLLQVVLGAILLPPLRSTVLLVVAAVSFGVLTVRSVPLSLPPDLLIERDLLFSIGQWISFAMVATLLVLFIARISRTLRAHEDFVASLRQHAAEEDGIVRMGLFASGAAHELGTPLGSLSVVLNDWRRVPAIASDPDLSMELEETLDELQRCKAIVSDILHSAGEPRGEAMSSSRASVFLDRVVEGWRPTHPSVPLDDVRDELGEATIVADPALRQAIWSLLDNAAEACPAGIQLQSTRSNDALTIAVLDRGSGFSPTELASVGKLYQSSKGAGHGLGLFLAANVARRLGGRLEADNHDGGGAEVRLVVPLVLTGTSEG
jgi:two-component system sensor histidine kinase RegB